jgi:hypothetical protein
MGVKAPLPGHQGPLELLWREAAAWIPLGDPIYIGQRATPGPLGAARPRA